MPPPQLPAAQSSTTSPLFAQTFAVSDPNLAACLMAVGIAVRPGEEVSMLTGDAKHLAFNFIAMGPDGMSTEFCIAAWNQQRNSTRKEDDFTFENPDHPFSYAMCSIANRIALAAYLKSAKPTVCIKRGSSIAAIDPGLDRARTDFILARIGQ